MKAEMTQKPYDVLIFDWDGTLLNSADHIAQCICEGFDAVGLEPPTMDEARNIIGLGMVEAIQFLRPGIEQELIVRIREAYAERFFSKQPTLDDLFDGVIDMLEAAASQGFKLAIATGKSRPGMDVVLRQLGMTSQFHVVRCADETRSKPHPLMLQEILQELALPVERALMIGDTEYDMSMAHSIEMDRLGVSYGVHGRERLLAYDPIACIDSMRYLHEVIEQVPQRAADARLGKMLG